LNEKPVSDTLRLNVLTFYSDPGKLFATKKNPKEWEKVRRELEIMKEKPPHLPIGSI
jgi:hypothetical protein